MAGVEIGPAFCYRSRMAGPGKPGPAKRAKMACTVPDCSKPQIARGLCTAHYQRWKAHGEVYAGRPVQDIGGAARWLADHVGHQGDECLTWPYIRDARGYGQAPFEGRQTSVQFAMCSLAHGPRPSPEHQAAHSCGKGHEACANPRHLSWKTQTENMADQIEHGTRAHGERHGRHKLTAAQVEEIRRIGRSERQIDIAARFGVRRETVGKILRGEKWVPPRVAA